MVIAMNSGVADMQAILDLVWKHLIPAAHAVPLPAPLLAPYSGGKVKNQLPTEAAALEARCKSLQYAPPALAVSPVEAVTLFDGWNGKNWTLSENAFLTRAVGFSSAGHRSFFILEDERGKHRIPFGWGVWEVSESTLKRQPGCKRRKFPSFASANWKAPDCILLTCRFPETPDWYMIELIQTSDTDLEMSITINVSFGPGKIPTVAGKIATS